MRDCLSRSGVRGESAGNPDCIYSAVPNEHRLALQNYAAVPSDGYQLEQVPGGRRIEG